MEKLPEPKKKIRITTNKAALLGLKVSHKCKAAKREVELELTKEARCPYCGTIFQVAAD